MKQGVACGKSPIWSLTHGLPESVLRPVCTLVPGAGSTWSLSSSYSIPSVWTKYITAVNTTSHTSESTNPGLIISVSFQ